MKNFKVIARHGSLMKKSLWDKCIGDFISVELKGPGDGSLGTVWYVDEDGFIQFCRRDDIYLKVVDFS